MATQEKHMVGLLHKSSSSAIQQSVAEYIDYRGPPRRLSLMVDSGNREEMSQRGQLLVPTKDSSRLPPNQAAWHPS